MDRSMNQCRLATNMVRSMNHCRLFSYKPDDVGGSGFGYAIPGVIGHAISVSKTPVVNIAIGTSHSRYMKLAGLHVSGCEIQEDMKKQLITEGKYTEEELEEYMNCHKKLMIDSLWKLNELHTYLSDLDHPHSQEEFREFITKLAGLTSEIKKYSMFLSASGRGVKVHGFGKDDSEEIQVLIA
ncbi:hypothetical protein CTI12_AA147670 [Artemisia annua]|uniref:Uncharacterized protein n=1 Tax=Artemisia annua TaxID=35608 RepID=A0A2U1PID8_ARTAN|nr:hypothetical protein CTI12_AA147670 [Artemisia annua]